jgi:hypothetical protein
VLALLSTIGVKVEFAIVGLNVGALDLVGVEVEPVGSVVAALLSTVGVKVEFAIVGLNVGALDLVGVEVEALGSLVVALLSTVGFAIVGLNVISSRIVGVEVEALGTPVVASTSVVGGEVELGSGLIVVALGSVGAKVELLTVDGAVELAAGVDPFFVVDGATELLGVGVVPPLFGFRDGVALAWLNILS